LRDVKEGGDAGEQVLAEGGVGGEDVGYGFFFDVGDEEGGEGLGETLFISAITP
jgi:hypothetical protein